MTTPADLTIEERADATLVVRLLGALAQGATTERGSDVGSTLHHPDFLFVLV